MNLIFLSPASIPLVSFIGIVYPVLKAFGIRGTLVQFQSGAALLQFSFEAKYEFVVYSGGQKEINDHSFTDYL